MDIADPYLNTDAGTMSPFEHGEVFVLDDGGEVKAYFTSFYFFIINIIIVESYFCLEINFLRFE